MRPSRPRDFTADTEKLIAARNRGALADLRHGIAGASASRAWPHVAPYCDLRNSEELPAFLVVGAGLAMHEGTSATAGNFGNTLRRIATEGKDGATEEGLNTFAARFRRLLTCTTTRDVCAHLPGILRAAARRGIPVNYQLLLEDLLTWNKGHQEVKMRWAEAYWGGQSGGAAQGGEA